MMASKSPKSKLDIKVVGLSDLETVGIPGRNKLREALTTTDDPLAAIDEFQEQNGIQLQSLHSALPFLDLHEIKRFDFHTSVMEELRERMLSRIKELAIGSDKSKQKILNDLLVKSFPLIKIDSLRPVVMSIMKGMPNIRQEYLQKIMDDPDLYNDAPVEVKQQIWQDNQALFGDEVSPLLQKYIQEKEEILFRIENNEDNFFSPSPKTRRQREIIQKLTKMVGRNIKLYDMMLQFLRTLYLRSRNIHYCTLRAELLMSLHDLEIHEICSLDPCHKFSWCLDACIREHYVDSKRARELREFLDNPRKGQEAVIGDLSMIMGDPFAINTISMSLLKCLQQTAHAEDIPRNNEELQLLLRMLALGLDAWHIIDSQVFKEPKVETPLVTRFLPSIMSLMIDEQMNAISAKIPESGAQSIDSIPDIAVAASQAGNLACTIFTYYNLNAAMQKDTWTITRTLPLLALCDSDTVYQDAILHAFVSAFAAGSDQFLNPAFLDAVIGQFFMTSISSENVLRHLMRLLWWVHPKIPGDKLETFMQQIKPNDQHSKIVQGFYTQLSERILTHQPAPEPWTPKDELESPLRSVPAPTPAHV